MRGIVSFFVFVVLAGGAMAESVVATRTIRAQTVLQPADLSLVEAVIPGAVIHVDEAIGLETRVTLYAGRAIRFDDLGPPAVVDRNQLVVLSYQMQGLAIVTEGRALARGGVGDVIRVMNLSSRTTISGRIGANGTVQVGPNP
jgi:flagella basal body P-ring formation protein FlgA